MPASEDLAPRLGLKKGRDKPIRQKHQWIYSGAIAKQSGQEGIAEVCDSAGTRLGHAFVNRDGSSIAAHMIALGEEGVADAISRKIKEAVALRKAWFEPTQTNAIRLINAEGDLLPGLIVDAYDQALVVQLSHPSMELFQETIVATLIAAYAPRAIYEKSTSFLRKKTGLAERRALLFGEALSPLVVRENGLRFLVDLQEGQKTGLFLDQREMRLLIRRLSSGKRVLNAFAYTAGFSVAALAGGAVHVDSVEISGKCQPFVEQNLLLNQLDPSKHRFFQEDVFDFLKNHALSDYDLLILDPPAFVKKREDVSKAFRAYKDLNAYVLARMKPHALLLTCSCSYHIDTSFFQNILFRAALEARRDVQILGTHIQALDHPISLFHPESTYLKSLFLAVK